MAIKLLKINRMKKPNLKLKPNHYKYVSEYLRIYRSYKLPPARSDGKGWYK